MKCVPSPAPWLSFQFGSAGALLCLAVPWVLERRSYAGICMALSPGLSPQCSSSPWLLPGSSSLVLLWALVTHSISPSHCLPRRGILETTLNARIICSPLSPRGQLRRQVQTDHQPCLAEVSIPGEVLGRAADFPHLHGPWWWRMCLPSRVFGSSSSLNFNFCPILLIVLWSLSK